MNKEHIAIVREVAQAVLDCFQPAIDKKDGKPDCNCINCCNYRRAKKLVEAIGE